jgi:hypothetical protein
MSLVGMFGMFRLLEKLNAVKLLNTSFPTMQPVAPSAWYEAYELGPTGQATGAPRPSAASITGKMIFKQCFISFSLFEFGFWNVTQRARGRVCMRTHTATPRKTKQILPGRNRI